MAAKRTDRVEAKFPLRGLSDLFSSSDQPELTTSEAVNVRSIDPKTGQVRGAQRSGQSKLTETRISESSVQALECVSYDVSPFQYTGQTPAVEWDVRLPGGAKALYVTTDLQEDIYVVSDDNRVYIYNSDGELSESVELDITADYDLASKLWVGLDRDFIVAAQHNSGITSSLIKMSTDEDGNFLRVWELTFSGAFVDFVVHGNLLYLAYNLNEDKQSYVDCHVGHLADNLHLAWSTPAVWPVAGIAVAANGDLVVSSAENSTRHDDTQTVLDEGEWPQQVVDWKLDNLDTDENDGRTDWRNRLFFHLDAAHLQLLNEQRVDSITNEFGSPYFDELTDDTVRKLGKSAYITFTVQHGGSAPGPRKYGYRRHGPKYALGAFGALPGLRFYPAGYETKAYWGDCNWGETLVEPNSKGTSLTSRPMTLSDYQAGGKTTADGSNPTQKGIIPSLPYTPWTLYLPARPIDTEKLMVLFTHCGGGDTTRPTSTAEEEGRGLNFTIYVNGKYNGGSDLVENHPGWTCIVFDAIFKDTGTPSQTEYCQYQYSDLSGTTVNPNHVINYTIHWHAQPFDSSANNVYKSFVRINGQGIRAFRAFTNRAVGSDTRIYGYSEYGTPPWNYAFPEGTIEGPSAFGRTIVGAPSVGATELWVNTFRNVDDVVGGLGSTTNERDRIVPFDTDNHVTGRVATTIGSSSPSDGGGTYIVEAFHGFVGEIIVMLGTHPSSPLPGTYHTEAGLGFGTYALYPQVSHDDNDDEAVLADYTGTAPDVDPDGASGADVAIDTDEPGYGWSAGTSFVNRPTVSFSSLTTEVEAIEGYLAHKWGWSNALRVANTSRRANCDGLWDGHPYAGDGNFPTAEPTASPSNPVSSLAYTLTHPSSCLLRYNGANGRAIYAASLGGTGAGVAVDSEGHMISVGPVAAESPGEENVAIRKIIHQGTEYSTEESDGAWAIRFEAQESTVDLPAQSEMQSSGKSARLVIDDNDDVHWAVESDLQNVTYRKYDGESGIHLYASALGQVGGFVRTGNSVALPPDKPKYQAVDPPVGPEFVYVATDDGDSLTEKQLRKLRVVAFDANLSAGPVAKAVKTVAVAGGTISSVDMNGNVSVVSESALDAFAPYISSAVLYSKVYFTDGITYKVYDPELDTVSELISTGSGTPPKRARLMAAWRGRLILARTTDDAHNWYMSAVGDTENWDLFPPVIKATQAIAGNTAPAGKSQDIINALAPITDDLLVIGGDRSIARLTGDPMLGGQMDLISDSTGMGFGASWCKDPLGNLYFFGTEGGVYAMAPNGPPQKISSASIDRRLREINTSIRRIEMVWNAHDNGLHLFQMPYGGAGGIAEFYFWELPTNSWWQDSVLSSDVMPSASAVYDGFDSNDKKVLLGGNDGYLRIWDHDAISDDGHAVASKVLIGPIGSKELETEVRITRFRATLASEQNGAAYELHVGDNPEENRLVSKGLLASGANGTSTLRVRGNNVWIRLMNNAVNERWAVEKMSFAVYPAGRRRVRS